MTNSNWKHFLKNLKFSTRMMPELLIIERKHEKDIYGGYPIIKQKLS